MPREGRRAGVSGTVLFIDDDRWTGFDQLSATLRRRGFRTVRITSERSRFSHAVSRLCYDTTIHLDDLTVGLDATLSRAGVTPSDVLDLQCTEFALELIAPWVADSTLPGPVRDHLAWRVRALDKYAMSMTLSAAGVPVPRALDAATTGPAEAATKLGYPLVLKPRLGYGGIGIRILADETGVVDLADHPLQERPDLWYWDEFVEGTVVRYVACYRDGHISQEGTFVSIRSDEASLGPATSVLTTNDEALVAVGRATLATIGGRGLANIECVRSDDGSLRVIDVNLRVWGSALTLGQAGVGFAGAYVETLGADFSSGEPTRSAVPGLNFRVYPDAAVAMAGTHPFRAIGVARRDVSYFARSAGRSYALAGSLQVGRAALQYFRRSAGRRVRALRSPGASRA